MVLALPGPAVAQFGAVETLARNVSDLSFYYGRSGATGSGALDGELGGLTSFGVELLFEVATIPSAAARERRSAASPAPRRVLREVEVRRSSNGTVDTVYHYDVVRPSSSGYGPDDLLWTLELGIGYGQVQGLELRDPALDLNAMIRTLPSVSLYMSYEPLGTYLGLRTGFLRTFALQVIDSGGTVFAGDAEAFMMGALAGYAFAIGPTYLFVEAGYTARTFPSVEWRAQEPLPAGVPRQLDVSGWGLSAGIQFPVR
ncbi:MAG: hypothetical protein R3314_03890 [Longimicrobiales bacterium]|nr:hypothetical protein [Longimicrobiales bacterium]